MAFRALQGPGTLGHHLTGDSRDEILKQLTGKERPDGIYYLINDEDLSFWILLKHGGEFHNLNSDPLFA